MTVLDSIPRLRDLPIVRDTDERVEHMLAELLPDPDVRAELSWLYRRGLFDVRWNAVDERLEPTMSTEMAERVMRVLQP